MKRFLFLLGLFVCMITGFGQANMPYPEKFDSSRDMRYDSFVNPLRHDSSRDMRYDSFVNPLRHDSSRDMRYDSFVNPLRHDSSRDMRYDTFAPIRTFGGRS